MSLNVSIEDQGKLKRKIFVEVPLAEVKFTYDTVYAQIKSNVKIDGFRPGKFPKNLAEKRFKTFMEQEATRTLVPKYFQQAVDENDLHPASQPDFGKLDIDKNKPFKFEASFEIVPPFDLPALSKFTLKEQKPSVSKKETDERIEQMRKTHATDQDKGQEPCADGDEVTVNFVGRMDGEIFPGGTGNDVKIALGEGSFLADFEKGVKGMKAGETRKFELDFPEDYGSEELKGKTVEFEVTMNSVTQKILPPLDAEFFAKIGEIKDEKGLRENAETQISGEKERTIQQEYREELAKQIREMSDFDVPETLIEQSLHEFEHQLEHAEPEVLKDEKQLAQKKKEEEEKLKGDLQFSYVIEEFGRAEKIEISQEEVQQRFYMQAYMMQQNPQELIQTTYGENMLYQMHRQMLADKVLDHLILKVVSPAGSKKSAEPTKKAEKAAAPAKAKTTKKTDTKTDDEKAAKTSKEK